MLEIVDLVLEGVGDEVHEHQLLFAARWTGDPGLLLLVLGQKVGQVPVHPRLIPNLYKVRSGLNIIELYIHFLVNVQTLLC